MASLSLIETDLVFMENCNWINYIRNAVYSQFKNIFSKMGILKPEKDTTTKKPKLTSIKDTLQDFQKTSFPPRKIENLKFCRVT